MSSIRLPISVVFALVALMVAQIIYFYPHLPETVASHFDASGAPNGWMSRSAYVAIIIAATFLAAGSTAGIAVLLPQLQDSINIANKEYWLAPERRNETIGFIASSILWISIATAALLLVINDAVCRMNIEGTPRLDLPMFPTLAVFFAVIGTIVTKIIVKFRKTENNYNQQ